MTPFYAIIPAKVNGSKRLEGKPLLEVGGKPLVTWAARTAIQAGAYRVLVITDEPRKVSKKLPKQVRCVPMPPGTRSGTEAVWHAYRRPLLPYGEIPILNLQVDEAFLPPKALSKIPTPEESTITTLVDPMLPRERNDPNHVGAVLSDEQDVLWFSREGNHHWRHVGVYGFKLSGLRKFCELEQSTLAQTTKLEQMTVLAHPNPGLKYKAGISAQALPRSINTEEDLKDAR